MSADAVVIGGGFYGAYIAEYLVKHRGLRSVVLVDRASDILTRSSFANQARVHNGYHYARSFTTAFRSRVNAPHFQSEFLDAIAGNSISLYALARKNSSVTARQMQRLCGAIGAPLKPASPDHVKLFDSKLIDKVYLAEEQLFDTMILRAMMRHRLALAGVEIRFNAEVTAIDANADGASVHGSAMGGAFSIPTALVFNCTYSRLQHTAGVTAPGFGLRHELAEMVLFRPPEQLKNIGITVMDGPFFSALPFPSSGLHSLSHVRYTPHRSWIDDASIDPYAQLNGYHCQTRFDRMVRDAQRYVPCLADSEPVSSLFEVKTIMTRNDGDDGRPILFHRHAAGGRIFSILGGKIDNVYDIAARLDRETLTPHGRRESIMRALIGYSGFVGSSLARQTSFDALFRSSNIEEISAKRFKTVVCAGAPGQKWIADLNPEKDAANLAKLADHLRTVEAEHFVLISTVDVLVDSRGADETTMIDETRLAPYGRNRYGLERFVRDRFPHALIVRLPALVGPGLRKNAVFDLLNDNNLHLVDARSRFQFYPMANLWSDIQTALAAQLSLIHLAAEPLTMAEIASTAFARPSLNTRSDRAPADYDMQTIHASHFGRDARYIYSAQDSLAAIRTYGDSEPRTLPVSP